MAATKHSTANAGGPYQVPPDPNRWGAIGLAVGVHALLLAFLWVGVSWQNTTPVAVEAEIWDTTVQSAAPPPPPPQDVEEPEPTPPVPREIAPPKVDVPPPPKAPDIALEREKKRKEELERKKEEERVERERELAQKREDDKKAKALAEKKERELAEKEKRERELAEKKELAKKEEAEKKKKAEKEAKAKAAAEEALLAKLRDADLKRITTGTGTSGTAAKSSAPRIDKGWIAAITAKIKGNTSYGGSLDEPGNPTVSFRVDLLPTGEISAVKKIKSSGIPTFDDAVEKGINKSSPLPAKKDGTVERTLVIDFHMKDMQ